MFNYFFNNIRINFFGIPTYPSSFCLDLHKLYYFFFVLIEIVFDPCLFKELTISLLKSIKTSSTILITFLSVTLRPLMNLVSIFSSSNSFLFLGLPPCTTIIDRPSLLSILISSIKLLKIPLSIKHSHHI